MVASALYGVKHVLAVQLAVKGWHCVHMGMQFQQGTDLSATTEQPAQKDTRGYVD